MPKLFIIRFPGGDIFLIVNNTELKKSSKIFSFCFGTASLGGSGLSKQVKK